MKKILCLLTLLAIGQVCYADWNTFETSQQAYDRQSYNNYNTYQNNNHQMPLGGYSQPLGSTTGGTQYGSYTRTNTNSYNSNYSNNYSRSRYNSWGGY